MLLLGLLQLLLLNRCLLLLLLLLNQRLWLLLGHLLLLVSCRKGLFLPKRQLARRSALVKSSGKLGVQGGH